MNIITTLLITAVGLLHISFFILEFYLIKTPVGQKIFSLNPEDLHKVIIWSKNQGVYNLILGFGLFFTLVSPSFSSKMIQVFILLMIFIVGVYGAFSIGKNVFFIQALPALFALILVFIALAEPRINDIATNPLQPPSFISNDKAYDSAHASLQLKFYPLVSPLYLPLKPTEAFMLITDTIKGKTSWGSITWDEKELKIQAVASTGLMKFKDDIVIQVLPYKEGSSIQMRSKSRLGKSDFGANAHRIIDFFNVLQSRYEFTH
ncbi:MAG: DUF1304 family protein [Bdellovibrionales bacterium]|nr:DUF1304 family protein [Bdellovibrionales bacterium]